MSRTSSQAGGGGSSYSSTAVLRAADVGLSADHAADPHAPQRRLLGPIDDVCASRSSGALQDGLLDDEEHLLDDSEDLGDLTPARDDELLNKSVTAESETKYTSSLSSTCFYVSLVFIYAVCDIAKIQLQSWYISSDPRVNTQSINLTAKLGDILVSLVLAPALLGKEGLKECFSWREILRNSLSSLGMALTQAFHLIQLIFLSSGKKANLPNVMGTMPCKFECQKLKSGKAAELLEVG